MPALPGRTAPRVTSDNAAYVNFIVYLVHIASSVECPSLQALRGRHTPSSLPAEVPHPMLWLLGVFALMLGAPPAAHRREGHLRAPHGERTASRVPRLPRLAAVRLLLALRRRLLPLLLHTDACLACLCLS
jgi:hypothetical protein